MSFRIILHKITTRFPTNARTPNTQIQYVSTLFFSSSSQLDTPLPTSDVQITFGRLFSAWQHKVKWSTFLQFEIAIIEVNMPWKYVRVKIFSKIIKASDKSLFIKKFYFYVILFKQKTFHDQPKCFAVDGRVIN